MILRDWIIIALLFCCAYYCVGFIEDAHWFKRYQGWEYYCYVASPYVLSFVSIQSWKRCYVWRRMMYAKQAPLTYITRGIENIRLKKERPSILERCCALLFLIGLAGVMHHHNIVSPSIWIGALVFLYFFFKILLKR